MDTKIKYALTFAVGAAVGVAASWKLLKTKYEKIAKEEINSVIDAFSQQECDDTDVDADTDISEETPTTNPVVEMNTYHDKVRDYTTKEDTNEDHSGPYLITEDEYGEEDDYDCIELEFFADNVLVDDGFDIVRDPAAIIGEEALEKLKTTEDDSIFVRNPALNCDYEILIDLRKYSELDLMDKI